jgi:pSer/pThr/pTyr-binding forkhead associated (FHA) protein
MEGFSPFIALQNMNDMEVNPSDLIFVTFPNGEATSIGRLDDNGMILYENSVSRKHAKIYLHQEKNVFMLKDTDSKYGTLVYEKDPVFRLHSTIRAIEIGNTVFSFKII